jgi:hypothetical protein
MGSLPVCAANFILKVKALVVDCRTLRLGPVSLDGNRCEFKGAVRACTSLDAAELRFLTVASLP